MDFKKKWLKNNQTRPSLRLATWIAAIVILAALVELLTAIFQNKLPPQP
jgi:hypothetical protein